MNIQLILCVEADKRAQTDNMYIKQTILKFYRIGNNVRLSFVNMCGNHKTYDSVERDWGYYDVSFQDVYYVSDTKEFYDGYFSTYPGLIKNQIGKDKKGIMRDWYKESETRIRVAVRPRGLEVDRQDFNDIIKPEFKAIYIDIAGAII